MHNAPQFPISQCFNVGDGSKPGHGVKIGKQKCCDRGAIGSKIRLASFDSETENGVTTFQGLCIHDRV
jgi:hypothetical protein